MSDLIGLGEAFERVAKVVGYAQADDGFRNALMRGRLAAFSDGRMFTIPSIDDGANDPTIKNEGPGEVPSRFWHRNRPGRIEIDWPANEAARIISVEAPDDWSDRVFGVKVRAADVQRLWNA